MNDRINKATELYRNHLNPLMTVILGTVDSDGEPLASYAPFVQDDQKNFYVMLSGMSPHTANIKQHLKVSALFIEDEQSAKTQFARVRLTFSCVVEILGNEDPLAAAVVTLMRERHGKIVDKLASMPDFEIFKLVPQSGRFVMGFGAAYAITGDNLDELKHMDGGGNPHGVMNPHAQSAILNSEEELNEQMKQMIAHHMNENHADALCNICMYYAGSKSVLDARIISFGALGMDVLVTMPEGEDTVHVAFTEPLKNAQIAQQILIGMSQQARKGLGLDKL